MFLTGVQEVKKSHEKDLDLSAGWKCGFESKIIWSYKYKGKRITLRTKALAQNDSHWTGETDILHFQSCLGVWKTLRKYKI